MKNIIYSTKVNFKYPPKIYLILMFLNHNNI